MNGYIFNFEGRGAYSPDGKVAEQLTPEQIRRHNTDLAIRELEAMKVTGRAVLYLFDEHAAPDGFRRPRVGTWDGSIKFSIHHCRTGRHNMAGERLDVWFRGPDGLTWHGVNIGDNQIVRCRRNKA